MLKRTALYLALSIGLAASMPGMAQDAAPIEAHDEESTRLGTVTVIGNPHPVYGKGLSLFDAGEYEAAEIEFRRIAKRVKWGDEAVRTSAQLASLNDGVVTVTNPDGSVDTNAAFRDSYAANASRGEDIRKLDRQDIGFSHYMAGLSQIQQGEYKEAKTSLYSSIHFTKKINDAYFRVGLLELKDGRVGKVQKHIKTLEKRVAKCTPNCVDAAGNDDAANLALLKKGLAQLQAGELEFR